jgi:hypothetical protein
MTSSQQGVVAARDVHRLFTLRQRRENTSLAVMALTIIAVLLGLAVTGRLAHGFPALGGAVIFVAILGQFAYSEFNARCPACDARLGRLIRAAHFCPQCGAALAADGKRNGEGPG